MRLRPLLETTTNSLRKRGSQAAAVELRGHLDDLQDGTITGWAWAVGEGRSVDVEIQLDGSIVGTVTAHTRREDLVAAGIGDGSHSFAFALPAAAMDGRHHVLRAVFAGTGKDLVGSPKRVKFLGSAGGKLGVERPALQHHVGGPFGNEIRGWVFDPDHPNERLMVRLVLERPNRPPEVVATFSANSASHVVTPSKGTAAACGFSYRLPVQQDVVRISVYETSTNKPLTGSPIHVGVSPRLEGCLDGVYGGYIEGWAWAAQDDCPTAVDISVDGRFVGTAFAVDGRPDLRAASIGTGAYGFKLPVAEDLKDGRTHDIVAVFHGTAQHLAGSPATALLEPQEDSPLLSDSGDVDVSVGADRSLSVSVTVPAGSMPDPVLEFACDGTMVTRAAARISGQVPTLSDAHDVLEVRLPVGVAGGISVRLPDDRGWCPVEPPEVAAGRLSNCAETDDREAAQLDEIARSALSHGRIRMLVPIWGSSYIKQFCELCLPSLLSPRNIPHLVEVFGAVGVSILTRRADYGLFSRYPAFNRLSAIAKVSFVAIDDILDEFFEPYPSRIYPVALTHAFARGMRQEGAQAANTDFVFWNADFLAADGAFATLADSIRDGNRCTMAPSLRMNAEMSGVIAAHLSADGSTLAVPPQALVRIALDHPHPTVVAKTIFPPGGSTIENINQFYARASEDVLIARSFLMFMLHIRPERVDDEYYGFCDYAFVPEMVTHGRINYVCSSDQIFIAELQDAGKESEYITRNRIDIDETARTIDYWATLEHIEASRHLLIFNGGDQIDADQLQSSAHAQELDSVVGAIHARLAPQRPSHNQHIYWRDSYRLIRPDTQTGYEQDPPPPVLPRDETARQLRWTGYDVRVIRESWQDPPVNLTGAYFNPPKLTTSRRGATARWLDDLFETYVSAWHLGQPKLFDEGAIELGLSELYTGWRDVDYRSAFTGCRWGYPEQIDGAWWRLMGPGGSAVILHRVTQRAPVTITFSGRTFAAAKVAELQVRINGAAPLRRWSTFVGDVFRIDVSVAIEQVVASGGFLEIELIDRAGPRPRAFGFSRYWVIPSQLVSTVEDEDEFGGPKPADLRMPWPITPPTLAWSRALAGEALPANVGLDAGSGLVGTGWRHPFRYDGRFFRWIACEREAVYLRVRPGTDYRLEVRLEATLTNTDLMFGCVPMANGVECLKVEVSARPGSYILSAVIPRPAVDRYDGLLCLEFRSSAEARGVGRIEFAEPETGGLAVEAIRVDSVGSPVDLPESPAPRMPRGLADFRRDYVAARAPERPSRPSRREIACSRLGADYAPYADRLRDASTLVGVAWRALPEGAEADAEAASLWLEHVDRAIAADWGKRSGEPRAAPCELSLAGPFDGIGFGPIASVAGVLGRVLPAEHTANIFIRLDRSRPWTCDVELRSGSGQTQILRAVVDPDPAGRPGDPATDVVVFALPSVASNPSLQGCAVTRVVASPGASVDPAERSSRPAASRRREPGPTYVRLGQPGAGFAIVASRSGLDPWPYARAAARAEDGHLGDVIAAFEKPRAADPASGQALLRYLDGAMLRASPPAADDHGRVDLLAEFLGLGWGFVTSLEGMPARTLGRAGRASLVLEISRPGIMILTLEGVTGPAQDPAHDLKATLNGVSIRPVIESGDVPIWTGRTTLRFAAAGRAVLDLATVSQAPLGFRTVTLSDPGADKGIGAVVDIPVFEEPIPDPHAYDFPRDADELDRVARLVAVPPADLLVWRFGRDPALYRAMVRRLGPVAQRALDSAPRNDMMPSARSRAWLDLLDETLVDEMVAAGPAIVAPISPGLGAMWGLGFGPLKVDDSEVGRRLSAAGESVIFVPPQPTEYDLRIRLSAGIPRNRLLQLTVRGNRKVPVRHEMRFGLNGPELHVRITRAESDFGGGWVALRLCLADNGRPDVGVTFWPPSDVPTARCDLAVLDVAVDLAPGSRDERTLVPEGSETPDEAIRHAGEAAQGGNVPSAVAARRYPAKPEVIHCVIPVWGEAYVRTFLDAALPTHLVPGNLPSFRHTKLVYDIYTDDAGRAAIEAHPLFPVLRKAVDEVAFIDIRALRYEERTHHQLTLNYSVMNKAHQRSIARATAAGGALLFLNCDTIYSDGVFRRVWNRHEEGYRSVENLSIRTDRDRMLAALKPHVGRDRLLSLSSQDMTRIALRNLHWIAKGRFWNGAPDLTIPDNLYWQVADTAIIARATHYMPLYVFPRVREVVYSGTIDHGFVPSSGIFPEEVWRFEDASEPSSWELSLTSHDQYFPPYERGSVRDFARFLSLQCEAVHQQNLLRAVRISAEHVPEERWREVTRESALVLDAVADELRHYVLTPWRPDRSMRPDGWIGASAPDRAR